MKMPGFDGGTLQAFAQKGTTLDRQSDTPGPKSHGTHIDRQKSTGFMGGHILLESWLTPGGEKLLSKVKMKKMTIRASAVPSL